MLSYKRAVFYNIIVNKTMIGSDKKSQYYVYSNQACIYSSTGKLSAPLLPQNYQVKKLFVTFRKYLLKLQ